MSLFPSEFYFKTFNEIANRCTYTYVQNYNFFIALDGDVRTILK